MTHQLYRYLALFSIPIVWGAYAPLTKGLLPDNVSALDFFVLACFSSLLSFVCFVPSLWRAIGDAELSREQWAECGLMGLYLFAGQTSQAIALAFMSASTNAVLTQTSCLIVSLIECRSLQSRFHVWMAGLVVVGATLVCANDASGDDEPTGILLSCASAAFYALHTVTVGRSTADETHQSAVQLGVLFLLNTCLLYGVLASQRQIRMGKIHSVNALIVTIFNSLLGTAWTTFAMSYAQQHIDAAVAAMAYALEPFFAAMFSILLFGGTVTVFQWVGLLLLVAANVASNLRSAPRHDYG